MLGYEIFSNVAVVAEIVNAGMTASAACGYPGATTYRQLVDEMWTVGRLARHGGLTPKALRHYDRIGLLRPAVVDERTGQRYYGPAQVDQVELIARLRSVDLPLEQVRECQVGDEDTIARVLVAHRRRLTARLERTQSALHRLDHFINDGIGATMTTTPASVGTGDERALAGQLFNGVWRLLEKENRSVADDDRMVHMAHASRYHWGEVGSASNMCIGEWQVSHVYAVLGRAEPALFHARAALRVAQEAGIGDFQLAYAYEALARAHAVAGDAEEARRWAEQAVAAADDIAEDSDRELLLTDLESIPGQPRFW